VKHRKKRIVHISTVHNALDPRVRLKQLRSIAETEMKAYFVTGDYTAKDEGDGVTVRRITKCRRKRLWRMAVLAPKAVWIALLTPASVYHIHDPELLPWAWMLLFRNVPIFYDVHEDYSLAMQKKFYLPPWSRRVIGVMVGILEKAFSLPYRYIIAEYSYTRRFPRAVPILNYPQLSMLENGSSFSTVQKTKNAQLLYTGYVTVERGALNLARLVLNSSNMEITLAGRCFRNVARRIRKTANKEAGRIHIVGEGRYVPFQEILSYYRKRIWTAGIVLIPNLTHFKEKHLTKFFEFMAFGLPIIASDFPAWRRFICGQGIGLCVDPENPEAVKEAIEWIRNNPSEAGKMGLRGSELIRRNYNWESQAKSLIALYRSCIVK